jgi:hypothetical protein
MENLETENERNHAIDVALKQCDEIAELRQWKIDKNNELAVLRVDNVEQQDKIKSLESETEALQKDFERQYQANFKLQEDNKRLNTFNTGQVLAREELKQKIKNLQTVMIAAAEEIQKHWQVHCDAEGYGPTNLMHRLEQGIPAQYGYTAGAFERQDKRIKELEEALRENRDNLVGLMNACLRNGIIDMSSIEQPGYQSYKRAISNADKALTPNQPE